MTAVFDLELANATLKKSLSASFSTHGKDQTAFAMDICKTCDALGMNTRNATRSEQ